MAKRDVKKRRLAEAFAMHADQEESAAAGRPVRRKKVCPTCRAQVLAPPLELWALKGVLETVREYTGVQRPLNETHKALWDGACKLRLIAELFDPATFYHVIHDQEDDVLRGIVYEGVSDEERNMRHSEAVNVNSDVSEEGDSDEAGSLEDFVVGDGSVESSDDASSDSDIQSVSPPDTRCTLDSNARRARLQELRHSRARKHGRSLPSSDDEVINVRSDSGESNDSVDDDEETGGEENTQSYLLRSAEEDNEDLSESD
ncbi:hypothetical protein MVES1_003897 [Malassezia vespertilionis]|uniref:uncharacterized protein n=1 Tax=Malassezia vespertilionis TaxID=2020962 RepID=UPI0024B1CD27|nr:uncharacterized protein MVES1_003897 [Malassezia vespertilionis]WFD08521.1 hypothetical protein MVES1_003897 [Malassezia vespertilionis]